MTKKNSVKKLQKYARTTAAELDFQTVSDEPEQKLVTIKVVINGKDFIGVGSTIKKAKESAAKNALRSLSEKENQGLTTKNASKDPVMPEYKKSQPTAKPVQKNTKPAVLSTLRSHGNECLIAAVKPKSKGQKMLVYDEECNSKTKEVASAAVLLDDDGSTSLKTSLKSLEFCYVPSDSDPNTPDSSHHPTVQDGRSLEEAHEITSVRFRSNTEFEYKEELGKGGYGRVFKVEHILLKRDYAMKQVPFKDKALREAKALANLRHENIVQFFDCWIGEPRPQSESSDNSWSTSPSSVRSSESCLFILMELCETDTLRDWIDKMNSNDSMEDSERRRKSQSLMLEILSGVQYFHSKGFIHRDLKPTNIMFGVDGKVKIGDFGLVTVKDAQDQQRSVDKGTKSYMAPEQKTEHNYDKKVDIFSLGLINFELVWKICTVHERGQIWEDVRTQKLPEEFSHNFPEEFRIIKPMLSEKPEDRPEASQVKTLWGAY